MINHCEGHVIFHNIEHQLREKNLLEVFARLPNHINYLHLNIEDMTILYFY